MANLNETTLDDLAKMAPEQQIRYLDYPTECNLRKLLRTAQTDGSEGAEAREELRKHKDFYRKWGIVLFGRSPVEKEAAATPESTPSETVAAKSRSGGAPSKKICALVLMFGIVSAGFAGTAGLYLFLE